MATQESNLARNQKRRQRSSEITQVRSGVVTTLTAHQSIHNKSRRTDYAVHRAMPGNFLNSMKGSMMNEPKEMIREYTREYMKLRKQTNQLFREGKIDKAEADHRNRNAKQFVLFARIQIENTKINRE